MVEKRSSSDEFQPDALTRWVLNLDVTFHWMRGEDRFWFERQTPTGTEFVLVDAATGAQSMLPAVPTQHVQLTSSPGELRAPDGQQTVFRLEHDLWIRNCSDGKNRRITHDGEPHFAYGDIDPSFDRQTVARRRAGKTDPLRGVIWSPNSRFVVALRQDLRAFPERLFVTEYVPPDGGYTRAQMRRIPIAVDPKTPDAQLIAFDTRSGAVRMLAIDPQALNDYALQYFLEGVVWWSSDERTLFLVTANRGGSQYALLAIDLETGKARQVLEEHAPYNVRLNPFDYARPNVHVLSHRAECVWYSERTGYGHLYLYDVATGMLIRPLTRGQWVVFDLLHVDEVARCVYFTAATHDPKAHPYYRYLYSVRLDGGEPLLLTPETADHQFSNFFESTRRESEKGGQAGSSIAPSGRYFIDCFSTTDRAPEIVLRRISGELVSKVLTSDASALYRSGWRPPERVVAKAADGVTDLHGVITYPRDFDPGRKYPVIDSIYPGPQGSFAPRTFLDQLAGGSIHHLQTFADAGFIVVAIDARGTAHRSRAFRDAYLGTEDVFGAADHRAAIVNLAAQRPFMDLNRVGVRGQSFGGYGAIRSMLLFPEFFKVGVAATGPGDWHEMHGQTSIERFFGVPDSATSQAHYDQLSNTRLASRLRGQLLLIYGGIDENVPLKHAFAVFEAFITADKDVDMLILPNAPHAAPKEPYAIRRSVAYFLKHLAER